MNRQMLIGSCALGWLVGLAGAVSRAMAPLAAAFLLLAPGAAPAQDWHLAAKVNGEGITRARLQSRVDASTRQGTINYGGVTQPKQYQRMQHQVLEELIDQELLWQEAKRQGFVATAAEVDQALDEVRRGYDSDFAYQMELERNGFTPESYREDMKRRISVRHWVQETLAKDIVVSDDEIHEFYVANQGRMVQPEQINPRHVLIKVEAGADETTVAAARQRIEQILAEAKQGADFVELAKTRSEGPTAPRGGDLGFLARGQLVKPFEDAAFALQPGEISGVVRTRYGFHIIKLEARRAAQVVPEAQAAPSLRSHLTSTKLEEAIVERVRILREQGSIEILIPG
jgi:peptidyl-prolyl cis-trans isomerase C